jgi:hypothetical protein
VAFDLGCQGAPDQTEPLDKAARVRNPVHFRIGETMGIIIAYRAVAFA